MPSPAPVPYSAAGHSRKQVDRAGDALRDWWLDDRNMTPTEGEALGVAWDYRLEFQRPLSHVVMGLRSMVQTEGAERVVAQRLKRLPRIIEKLTRDNRSNLSRMQDIGGCRAILPDLVTVERVRRRIHKNKWDVTREDDYNVSPKSTGYRGVHVIIRKFDRPIEIQLRTPSQHDWALSVERIDLRRRYGLKDDNGPDEVLNLLRASAYAIHQESIGEVLTEEFDVEFQRLSLAAQPYL